MELETNNSRTCLSQLTVIKYVESTQSNGSHADEDIKSYRRRFWMLFIFSTLSMLNGMEVFQYASMANFTMCFYGVTAEAVNWTVLIFMVVYIVLVFPVSWLMSNIGLKLTIVIASIFNTLSNAVQFANLSPENFAYVILSSFLGSLVNVFVLAVPPCLAATWFPSKEVSRACAMGVFGNQLGVALGFIFSPLLITSDCSNKDLVAEGKRNVATILISVNTVVLLLIVFTFQNEPKLPPSIAQAQKKNTNKHFLHTILSMAKNINFVLVFTIYGLVVGTYFAFGTLFNYIFLSYFPGEDVTVGWLGLLVIVAGLLGSVIAGYVLDYTHRFKETAISICFLSFFFCVVFSCLLHVNKIWLQFITVSAMGFFLTGFLPVGFEYGIEVTYPESEIASAGLLNTGTMIFGILITEIASHVLESAGPSYATIVFCVALLTATVISCFMTKNYKRSTESNGIS